VNNIKLSGGEEMTLHGNMPIGLPMTTIIRLSDEEINWLE